MKMLDSTKEYILRYRALNLSQISKMMAIDFENGVVMEKVNRYHIKKFLDSYDTEMMLREMHRNNPMELLEYYIEKYGYN